jgi:hypothetical protein
MDSVGLAPRSQRGFGDGGVQRARATDPKESVMMNEAAAPGATTARKIVYTVTEKGEKSFWTRIGVAFSNRDGSLTVKLDAVPVNGTLQIRDEDFTRRNGGAQ